MVADTPYPQCGDCPYRKSSKGFVPGEGPAASSVLVCGEAPGKRELETGRPFVGPAGQELNQLLSIANINRAEVYITNACKCLPENKTPDNGQLAECFQRILRDEIDSHRFKYVLALGRIATTTFGVPQARKQGPAHGYILDRGSHFIMSTWHPAYIIRTQYVDAGEGGGKGVTARVEAQHDMLKFREFVDGNLPIENPPAHLSPLSELFADNPSVVSIDIETKGLDKFHNEPVLFGMSWRTRSGEIKMASETYSFSEASRVLSRPAWTKVFHNINFDAGIMYHSCQLMTVSPFSCTQMIGALLGSDLPKGLEFLARAYLNTQPWKWTQDTDPRRYNAIDCWATLRLYEEMTSKQIVKDGMEKLLKRANEALELTVYAHMRGVRVDSQRMRVISSVMAKKVKEAELRLNELLKQETGIQTLNWNSPKQVQHLLYEQLKLPKKFVVDQGTKRRRLTSNADALEELSALHPIPQSLRTYKLFSKYTSTYLNERLLHDGKLHPEFLMDVTATGRFASRGPNFQNQPRSGPIKSIYLPDRSDHYFVEVDFSQIEMRVMVHLSREPALEQAYSEGHDIHTTVAKQVFNKPEVTKEERHMAKYIVYGLGYGRGAASVAQQYGWPLVEAQAFIREFSRKFPILWEWRREQVRQADRQRYLANPFGRRRYFYGRNYETRAYNFIPQSTALDILIDGMVRLKEEVPTWRQMIWVHDSYCLSIPKKQIEEAKNELPRILGTCSLGWPTPIDIGYGDTWGSAVKGGA